MENDNTDVIDQELEDSLKTTPKVSASDLIDEELKQALRSQESMKETRKSMEDFEKINHDPTAIVPGLIEGAKDIPASIGRLEAPVMDLATGNAFNLSGAVKDYNQERNDTLSKQYAGNPYFSGGRVGGQIAASAPLMWAGGELAGAGAAGAGVSPTLSKFIGGATQNPWGWLPSRATQGAIQGTEVGGLTNASTNADPVDYTLGNAEAGAVLNPGLQLGSKLIGGATNFGLNKFAENTDPAAVALSKNLKADGFDSIEQAHQKLQEMGPHATWADLGPNTRDFLASTARMQGAPKKQALDFVEGRQMGDEEAGLPGQSQRIVSSLQDKLGVSTDYDTMKTDLLKKQAEESAPLYKQAFDANKSVQSPTIDRILETDRGAQALEAARQRRNTQMKLMGTSDPELTEQAADSGISTGKGIAGGFDLQTLHYMKMELDDQAEQAIKQFSKGDITKGERNDILDLRSRFRGALSDADSTAASGPNSLKASGGLYDQANAKWSGYQKQIDALDTGREFMSTGSAENEALLQKMSPGEKTAAKVGAVEGMKDAAANTPNSADIASRMFKTPEKQARFKALFDSPKEFQDFKKHVDNEQELHKLFYEMKGNSRTAGRQAVDQNPVPEAVGTLTDMATGNHGNLFMRALNRIGAPAQMTPETAMESSNLMLGPTQEAANRMRSIGAAGFGKRSFLPGYVKMLAGAYGIPATEMGMNAFSNYTPGNQGPQ